MPTNEMYSDAVTNLQQYLRQISYDVPEVPAPPVDGVFDSATEQSLAAFQQAFGLPSTGVADRETWDRLYAAYRASLSANSPPATVAIFPRFPEDHRLREGDTGFEVAALQYMLRELQLFAGGTTPITVDGNFGSETTTAVKKFQELHLLPESGEVDRSTWNHIADQHTMIKHRYPRE